MLAENIPEDGLIEERTIGGALSELLQYPTLELDPEFDYEEDCYEQLLPPPDTSYIVQGQPPESKGE